jgi:hypothetical protein
MAENVTLKHFDKDKSARELRSEWNWTVGAMIVVTILLIIALTAALFYGAISPYTTGGAVNP